MTSGYTQDYDYVLLFDYLTTIAAFILIKYLVVKGFPKWFEGKRAFVICTVGSLTFGIYLLDPYLKVLLYNRYEAFMEPVFPTLLVSFVWCVVSMLLGGTITFVIKRCRYFQNCYENNSKKELFVKFSQANKKRKRRIYWLFIYAFRLQYMIAAALAIIISTFSNWLFGRLLTFRHAEKQNIWKELGNIYLASIVGMLGNILLMGFSTGNLV